MRACQPKNGKPYPSYVSDEGWAFVAPYYLASVREDAPQRTHDLREVFDGLLRRIVRTGSPRRATCLTTRLPPWEAVYRQYRGGGSPQRSLRGDGPRLLRALLRLASGRVREATGEAVSSGVRGSGYSSSEEAAEAAEHGSGCGGSQARPRRPQGLQDMLFAHAEIL